MMPLPEYWHPVRLHFATGRVTTGYRVPPIYELRPVRWHVDDIGIDIDGNGYMMPTYWQEI